MICRQLSMMTDLNLGVFRDNYTLSQHSTEPNLIRASLVESSTQVHHIRRVFKSLHFRFFSRRLFCRYIFLSANHFLKLLMIFTAFFKDDCGPRMLHELTYLRLMMGVFVSTIGLLQHFVTTFRSICRRPVVVC